MTSFRRTGTCWVDCLIFFQSVSASAGVKERCRPATPALEWPKRWCGPRPIPMPCSTSMNRHRSWKRKRSRCSNFETAVLESSIHKKRNRRRRQQGYRGLPSPLPLEKPTQPQFEALAWLLLGWCGSCHPASGRWTYRCGGDSSCRPSGWRSSGQCAQQRPEDTRWLPSSSGASVSGQGRASKISFGCVAACGFLCRRPLQHWWHQQCLFPTEPALSRVSTARPKEACTTLWTKPNTAVLST